MNVLTTVSHPPIETVSIVSQSTAGPFSAVAWLIDMNAHGYRVAVWARGDERRLAIAFPESPAVGDDPLLALGPHAGDVVEYLLSRQAVQIGRRRAQTARKTSRIRKARKALIHQGV